jgi:hypothetical protein
MRVPLLSACLLLSLAACAADDESEPACPGLVCNPPRSLIEGIPAEDYYSQMIYREIGGERPYQYLLNFLGLPLADGRTGHAALYLLGDHSYVLDYNEWMCANNVCENVLTDVQLSGQWWVADADLVLDDLAIGHGADYNYGEESVPAAKLKFHFDVATAGLSQNEMLMLLVRGPAALEPQ